MVLSQIPSAWWCWIPAAHIRMFCSTAQEWSARSPPRARSARSISAPVVSAHSGRLTRNAPVLVGGAYVSPNLLSGRCGKCNLWDNLKGNALELTFRGRPSKYFSGQIQYTVGRTDNNTSRHHVIFPANSYNAAADWGAPTTTAPEVRSASVDASHEFFTAGRRASLYAGKPVDITTGGEISRRILNDRPAGIARNTMLVRARSSDLNLSTISRSRRPKNEAKVFSVSLNSLTF